MESTFLVTKSFKHKVDCFCSSKHHKNTIPFQRGDRIELTEDIKNVEPLGWYVRIVVNESYQVYVHIDDLEQFHDQKLIRSEMDLELEYNYYSYKVNASLDHKDQERFMYYVQKLEDIHYVLTKTLAKTSS